MTRRPNNEAREKILKAAHGLFAAAGYEAASMDKVAAAAGVKKANLFHYYRSKEALGAAVIEEAARRSAEGMRAVFDGTQEPVSAVRQLFDRGTAGMSRDCAQGCFIGKMGQELDEGNAALRRRLSECLGQWREDVTAYLESWRKRGYFRPGFKAGETADAVLALYEGGILLAKVTGDAAALDHARRAATGAVAAWKR